MNSFIAQYKSYSAKKPLKARILLSLFITLITLSVIRALIPVTIKFAANSWFESNNIESTIGKIEIALFKGSFAINNIKGTSETGKNFSLGRIAVFWQWKPLLSGRAFIENIEIIELKANSAFYKNGDMNLAGLVIKANDKNLNSEKEKSSSKPWDATVKRIKFSDVELCVEQFTHLEKADLDYCATLNSFNWDGDISFNPSTNSTDTAPIYANGTLKLKNITLKNNHLNLALIDVKAFDINKINIETLFNINIDQIEIYNFIALQRESKAVAQDTQLIGFDNLSINPISLSNLNDLKLGKIKLNGTQAFLRVNKAGLTDFAKWLPKKQQSTAQPAPQKVASSPFNYAIDEFTFNTNKHFIYVDDSLKERFSFDMHTIDLKFSNLNSKEPNNSSHANLTFKIDKHGTFKVDADLKPLANKVSVNGKGEISGLDLRMLAPFTKQHIGHSIKSGQLDADLKLGVKKGTIETNIGLVLYQFELKVLSKKEADKLNSEFGFPLNASLSLLRDRDNAIRLDIPVTGDISNPEFNPKDAIIKASAKAITSAVIQYYTPFGLVFAAGSLFDLATALNFDPVIFSPNISELSPAHQEQLSKLATLMSERPGVHLTLCGISNKTDKELLFPVEKTQKASSGEKALPEKPLSDKEISLLKKLAETRSSNVKNYMIKNKAIKASRLIECTPEFETNGISGVEISI